MNVDIHALVGAYALNAVDDIERAAFAQHFAECESCSVEVAELRETATRLAAISATAPPPRMRANVLEQVSRTRQVAPQPSTRAPAQARSRRWLAAVAAGAVIAAGAAGTTYAIAESRVRAAESQASEAEQIRDVLSAADAQVAVTAVGTGRLVVVTSPKLNESVVVVKSLASPGAQAYQLWMAFGGEPKSIGVLPAGAVNATRLINGTAGATALMVSQEPAGGSPTPTKVVGTLNM